MKKLTRPQKIYKILTLGLIILIVVNLVSYYFITGPGVFTAQAASIVFQLEIVTPIPITPIEEIITGGGGGGGPIPPSLEIKIFIDKNKYPILKLTEVTGISFEDLPASPGFTGDYVTFSGWTNIKDAIIFLQLTSEIKTIATVFADQNGYWQWTNFLPLAVGSHSLTITALSPADTNTKTAFTFNFQRVLPPWPEKPEAAPTVEELPTPTKKPATPTVPVPKVISVEPLLPPAPPAPILEAEQVFGLDSKVVNKLIYPRDDIEIKTEIIKFKPDERQELKLKYIVKDSGGKIVFEEEKDIGLEQRTQITKKLKTSFLIEPGIYKVVVQLAGQTQTFTTADEFIVEGKPLVRVGERVILTEQELSSYLMLSLLILMLLLILFAVMLYNEYRKAKRDEQIDEQDLKRSGLLN